MKVLIVANNKPGRFSPFVLEQVKALEQLGVEFDFFGVNGKGIYGYLSNLPALKKKIHDYHPDIVHAHYGLSGLLANLQRTVPVITTYHGSDIHSMGWNLFFSKISMFFSAYNIFVSNCLQNISGYKGDNQCVIPCGVDTSTFYPIEREKARKMIGWKLDKKIILFAGAFDNKVKNSRIAKTATSLIPDAELIELSGYDRKQVNIMVNAANCLLMTSLREGSPVVIKEAMACGTPIVTVNVGDVCSVTSSNEGCYISTYDTNDVAAKIRQALSFKGKTNGPQCIAEKGLSNDIVVKSIYEIYQKVVCLSKR